MLVRFERGIWEVVKPRFERVFLPSSVSPQFPLAYDSPSVFIPHWGFGDVFAGVAEAVEEVRRIRREVESVNFILLDSLGLFLIWAVDVSVVQ